MTNHKQVVYQSQLDHKSKLVLRRRTRRRFNPKIFVDRTIETIAIVSLLLTGFSGVGAMACWGLEIIEINANSNIIISGWQQQKSICLGVMLVSFSAFLGSSLVGASFSIQRDKF
ncbi:hypothetical protein [Nostoc sp. 'Peltigera membranacea cyanobiont' 232]|uniref:hypothetical protein n=1 Tax=Nostoc sp. 'Peltigera membranacea cyanobiont' 232 TaxID=2014531 RepID=UPI000B95C276|nr:hypothetical protein [Nostoc sp. 'Peltigera membranacea cyanobiont' 232]OYE00694.1 hypothetical protein CDG79_33690 [Nostoc sp. 'Peltigera membranacea cyanobiont' 232]